VTRKGHLCWRVAVMAVALLATVLATGESLAQSDEPIVLTVLNYLDATSPRG